MLLWKSVLLAFLSKSHSSIQSSRESLELISSWPAALFSSVTVMYQLTSREHLVPPWQLGELYTHSHQTAPPDSSLHSHSNLFFQFPSSQMSPIPPQPPQEAILNIFSFFSCGVPSPSCSHWGLAGPWGITPAAAYSYLTFYLLVLCVMELTTTSNQFLSILSVLKLFYQTLLHETFFVVNWRYSRLLLFMLWMF